MLKHLRLITLLLGALLAPSCALPVPPAYAETITFTWNANAESDLAGYKLYQGTVSGQYGPPVTLGNVTTHTLTLPTLTVDQAYFWAVTAYDLAGNESPKSDEFTRIVTGVPLPPALPTPTGFAATALADGQTRISWDDMQLASGPLFLLRIHLAGTPYEPCEGMAYCGNVTAPTGITLNLPPGSYDAWVHSAKSSGEWGPSAGMVFVVPTPVPVDLPPVAPTGFTIASVTASEVVLTASLVDCPNVIFTAAAPLYTVTCGK